MSWRSQGHTKQVHNISQKFVVFSTICKLCPGDFQAILFWFHIVPESKLIFLRMSWRSQGHTKQVHNISQKIVVFSTTGICKLCPGDFQAILFWFDIVPNFHPFFFQMSWRSQGQKIPSTQYVTKFVVFFNYL